MTEAREALIRERAYAIWQAEGSPEGCHDQHWRQAAQEVGTAAHETRDNAIPAPAGSSVPAAASPRARRPVTAYEAKPAAKPRRRKAD